MKKKIITLMLGLSLFIIPSPCYAETDFDSIVPEDLSKDELVDAYNDLRDTYNALYDLYLAKFMQNGLDGLGGKELEETESENTFVNNFLSEEQCTEIRGLLTAGDFEGIKASLENTDVPEDVISAIDNVIAIKDDLYYSIDDFEGKTWIFDTTNFYIDPPNVLVPYIYLGSGNTRCKYGFTRGDWLFFENVKIKLENGEIIERDFDRYDEITTDTLSGGMISEIADVPIEYDWLSQISESPYVTVRFTSRENSHIDYDTDTDNFVTIKTVKDAYDKVISVIGEE